MICDITGHCLVFILLPFPHAGTSDIINHVYIYSTSDYSRGNLQRKDEW